MDGGKLDKQYTENDQQRLLAFALHRRGSTTSRGCWRARFMEQVDAARAKAAGVCTASETQHDQQGLLVCKIGGQARWRQCDQQRLLEYAPSQNGCKLDKQYRKRFLMSQLEPIWQR